MTDDLKALRYLTAPNQPQSDHASKSPGIENGGPMFCMDPHDHRCCQHNAGHAWPNFAQHLWYAAPGNGLAALLYAPCIVRAKVGTGTEVTIVEDTHYPFGDRIELTLDPERPVEFPLLLRIPGWCTRPEFRLNGQRIKINTRPGAYLRMNRTWDPDDRIEIKFPMELRIRTWRGNHNSVSIDRGPLTYSLRITERYVRHGGTDAWPAWDIFPDSPWNYSLVLPEKNPARALKVIQNLWPDDDQPFVAQGAPIQIQAKARRIPAWTLDDKGLVQEVPDSPVRSTERIESVTLIPMGAARLRIASFPVIGK
jgi:hypothetical protein